MVAQFVFSFLTPLCSDTTRLQLVVPLSFEHSDVISMVDKSTVHGKLFNWIIGIWKVGFWGKEKTGVAGVKPLGARERTNSKFNPLRASMQLPPTPTPPPPSQYEKTLEVSLKPLGSALLF